MDIFDKPIIDVIIPAFNEEKSIGKVVSEIPLNWVRNIYVANNGSTDATISVAESCGAIVVTENRMGYGWACLKAMDEIAFNKIKPDIIVFLDGDYSDYPIQLIDLVKPIVENDIKLVIGSRVLGKRERNSLTPQQVFGNWLATKLMRIFYRLKYTDLGPFRAIDYKSLVALQMADKTYGWTIEMQLKAGRKKMAYCEIPVDYRKRIGVSKVSGTIKGSVLAGIKIIFAVWKYRRA
jgi:glycosyltransferase involved in cell wall biosynthesis